LALLQWELARLERSFSNVATVPDEEYVALSGKHCRWWGGMSFLLCAPVHIFTLRATLRLQVIKEVTCLLLALRWGEEGRQALSLDTLHSVWLF
jgi:hypothetical protein